MDFKVRRTYSVKNTHEISVDYGGNNFLIIYGSHINGWFIAIPNWNFCTEAATPTDTFYNIERLKRTDIAGIKDAADSIAFAIKFHYEALRDKEDGGI